MSRRPGSGGVGAVLFAVYWRALAFDEWRLHSQHVEEGDAYEERGRLSGNVIAGWRVEQTLVLQCAPGLAPRPCLVLQELDVAPPLVPRRPGPRWSARRPYLKAEQARRAWRPLRIVADELDEDLDVDPGPDIGADLDLEIYDDSRDQAFDFDDEGVA